MNAEAKDFKEVEVMDPGIAIWASDFDRWLETEEGKAWLKSRAELEAERRGTDWEGIYW